MTSLSHCRPAQDHAPPSHIQITAMLRNKFLLFLVLLAPIGCAWGQLNNACRLSLNSQLGGNNANIRLNHLRVYNTVPVGGELGYARLDTTITCFDKPSSRVPFTLQIYPGTASAPGVSAADSPYVCQTNLDGVGVTFYAEGKGSQRILCNHWGAGLEIPWAEIPFYGTTKTFSLNVPNIAAFIRTQPATPLAPGMYQLNLRPESRLISYWPTVTNSSDWGKILFSSSVPLLVTTCSMTNIKQTVDFKTVPMVELQSTPKTEDFYIDIGNCGSKTLADNFNNAVSFRFISANINSGGRLALDTCQNCATGAQITIKNRNNAIINLNNLYALKNSTSDYIASPNGDYRRHHFKAELARIAAGTPLKAGEIRALLTVVVTSL